MAPRRPTVYANRSTLRAKLAVKSNTLVIGLQLKGEALTATSKLLHASGGRVASKEPLDRLLARRATASTAPVTRGYLTKKRARGTRWLLGFTLASKSTEKLLPFAAATKLGTKLLKLEALYCRSRLGPKLASGVLSEALLKNFYFMFNWLNGNRTVSAGVNSTSTFFLNLNKWPIDKAPKVSASSYLVGLGLGLMFHLYAFSALEKFMFINYNFFSVQGQVLTFIVLALVAGLMSSSQSRVSLAVAGLLVGVVVLFIFFFYGVTPLVSKWYRESSVLQSRFLILNWDFYLFTLFFFGWVFKVAKKYSVESYTKAETLLYKSLLPTLMVFEAFTFGYLVIWRYINSTLLGYSTVMYLSFYKNYYVTEILASKLFFFLFACFFVELLIKSLKMSNPLVMLIDYSCFLVALSIYLFIEFKECWTFLHSVAQANTFKFTYFKYFYFLLMFNFFHAFLGVLINYVFIVYLYFKTGSYGDYYETLYFNYKVLYFLLMLSCALYVSVYVISEIALYGYYTLVYNFFIIDLFLLYQDLSLVLGHWLNSESTNFIFIYLLFLSVTPVAYVSTGSQAIPFREHLGYLLLIYAASIFFLFSNNFFIFIFFYEMAILPIFFILRKFGHYYRRTQAAFLILIWALLGSFFLFIGAILASYYGETSFSGLVALPVGVLGWFSFFFTLGFLVKVPMWPFHFWISRAHAEGPTNLSIFLSGVLVKLSVYGILKVFTIAAVKQTFFLFFFCSLVGVIDSTLKMLIQVDSKVVIAFSTTVQMNFALFMLFTIAEGSSVALNLALLNHMVTASILFFISDTILVRFNTREFFFLGGLYSYVPVLSFFILFSLINQINFPGFLGFVLDINFLISVLAAYPLTSFLLFFFLFAIEHLYIFFFFLKICFGVVNRLNYTLVKDLNLAEVLLFVYLLSVSIFWGLFPLTLEVLV